MMHGAFWMLTAAHALAGEAPPPLTEYQATSRPPASAAQAPPFAMPLARDAFNRLTVPVRLGLAGPYRFLVDTGSDRTAVSSELAGKLALEQGKLADMHSSTGVSRVRMAHVPELRLSGRSVRNIRAPMLDAKYIGADGILGIDSLRSQRITFDFRSLSLSIHAGPAPTAEADTILVRARRKEGRLVVTDAEIDGVRVRVVIDTGSTMSVGNLSLRRRLESRSRLEPAGTVDLVSVTGALLRGELARVRHLDIGGARLEQLGVVFAEAHTFKQLRLDAKPALLLGMDAMHYFDQVTIDFADKTLSLVLPRGRKKPP